MTILESLLERQRQAELDRRRARNDIIWLVATVILGGALLLLLGVIL